jgi:hypothetical protein
MSWKPRGWFLPTALSKKYPDLYKKAIAAILKLISGSIALILQKT